jgi:hypothetical protein
MVGSSVHQAESEHSPALPGVRQNLAAGERVCMKSDRLVKIQKDNALYGMRIREFNKTWIMWQASHLYWT